MAADHVDVNSMYEYAKINRSESAQYYHLASDKGDIRAMNNYAWMLQHEEGIEKNLKKAAYLYKTAAEKGQIDAIFNYAWML